MQVDLNRSTAKKTGTGKNYKQPICQGQFYTLLSHAKSGGKVLLLNFQLEDIKGNESAVEENVLKRKEWLFSWQQPIMVLVCFYLI